MDPPEHGRLRKRLTGAFTVKRMKQLEEHIGDIVERQLDHLAQLAPPVDLVREFALPVPSLVICELLGVPYADRDTFQANAAQFMVREQTLEEKMGAYIALNTYLSELVTNKRAEPGDDILSDLARHDDLTVEELTGAAFLLLLAGHETTANMISLGTLMLLRHPDALAALREDPAKIPNAVEELLRYFTIAELAMVRVATEDVEIGGTVIPAGEGVLTLANTGNRDPHVFEDADRFDIDRGARNHLAFGYGPHQCLGQNLARVELEIVFETLFRRVPGLRLAVPAEELSFKDDATVYGMHELPVTW
jgi:cytochrome P450